MIRAGLITQCAIALAISTAACAREGAPRDLIARGDSLFAQQRYQEAAAEYRRALASTPDDPSANARLGIVEARLGQNARAYHHLLTARGKGADNPELFATLGTLYMMEGMPELARENASMLLDRDSLNPVGLTILGATSVSHGEIAEAIRKLQAAKPRLGNDIRPRLALANLLLGTKDTAGAQKELEEAASIDPRSIPAHAMLADLSAAVRNAPLADRERKSVADLQAATERADAQTATSFIILGRRASAEAVLRSTLAKDSSDVPTRRALAELALANGNPAGSIDLTAPLLARDSSDADAGILRGRAFLVRRETDSALVYLQRVALTHPDLAPVHYHLSLAHLQKARESGSKASADSLTALGVRELREATRLVKVYPEAVFQLAELNTQGGNAHAAITDVEDYLRSSPRSFRGHVLLGVALLASGRPGEAVEAFRQILQFDSTNAQGHYWVATGLLKQGEQLQAVDELETAARQAPGFAEAVSQLVIMDLTANRPDPAMSRVQKEIARAPRSAPLYDLLGLVYAAKNEQDSAETAFRKAVELEPRMIDARTRLAELYASTGRFDQASAEADTVLEIDPTNLRALMALGTAAQQKGDANTARRAYERALAINPKFGGAANNLAFLYSEQVGDQNSALKFASMAQEIAPDDPHVMDTLGWVLYKRGELTRALNLLKASANRLPDSPSIQYHLGMAAKRAGDTLVARQALTRAATSSASFAGKDEARKALDQMSKQP